METEQILNAVFVAALTIAYLVSEFLNSKFRQAVLELTLEQNKAIKVQNTRIDLIRKQVTNDE